MNIAQLCKRAYENARAHGFYDDVINATKHLRHPDAVVAEAVDHAFDLAAIACMHSALAEAADADPTDMSMKIPTFLHTTEGFANLLIRIFTWCGYREYDLESAWYACTCTQAEDVCRTLPQLIAECHYHLGCATEALRRSESPTPAFAAILSRVDSHYTSHSPDLILCAVAAKMKYNEARPYKHGK